MFEIKMLAYLLSIYIIESVSYKNHMGSLQTCVSHESSTKLTREAINSLPLYQYTGNIHLVSSEYDVQAALGSIALCPYIGFDTETRPSFQKGKSYNPSLIQVATIDDVFIFQLASIGFSEQLIKILEDCSIVKIGVAIDDDLRSLKKMKTFVPGGSVDLAHIAQKKGIAHMGLRGLAAYFLGVRISKGEQCSNWGKKDLTERQIRYAATDAWACLAIYLRMREKGLLR